MSPSTNHFTPEKQALIEILNQDGTMARLPQLLEIAEKFQLKIIAIKDIQEYRRNNKI